MAQNNLPKTERVTKKTEFDKIYTAGYQSTGQYIKIYYLCNQRSRKIGITVSKKLGIAVKRNKAKRLIREIYRLNKTKIKEGTHLLISVKPEIVDVTYKELEKDFNSIINRINNQ